LNEFETYSSKGKKKKVKMPTLHANARAKAKERAAKRLKERAEKGDVVSDSSSSLDVMQVEQEKSRKI